MSKNYDLIATVDIDIASPIVDDTSFDNLLIVGPLPKIAPEKAPPKVGAYSSLDEVTAAGWVASGEDADPVGAAAMVAFSQSPTPNIIYIAPIQPTENAVAAANDVASINGLAGEVIGKREDMAGCKISLDTDNRILTVKLTGAVSTVKNTGVFDFLSQIMAEGYTVSIGDAEIKNVDDFKATYQFQQISGLKKGGDPVELVVTFKKGDKGVESKYGVVVAYPSTADASVSFTGELPDASAEVENPVNTLQRAVSSSGWYVACAAGIDPKEYEGMAAYIETQERLFSYTEMGFFDNLDKDEQPQPTVGPVYFRTLGIYGRESSDQTDKDVPAANWYMNVAFVAKWLNYSSGSETSAFKTLAAVYPSGLTTTEMKALEAANLNYFITVGNKNVTMNGKVIGDEWADVIRFRDWLKNDMQVRVVNLFITRPKVPYTDSGIALVQNQMIASLKAGQDAGGIAETEFDEDGGAIPGFVTSVPLSASLSASEKASRKLKKCKFTARLAGAIHFAELKGTLAYEL